MAEASPAGPAGDGRLLLLANEAGEVPLISALVQDAIVHAADIAWTRPARRLVLLVNRFRWEAGNATRIRCALRFEHVTRVQRRAWPHGDAVLDLLAITVEDAADGIDPALTLAFAAGPTLRVAAECVDLILEDLGEPWPAAREPAHVDAR
jgi:hypothetical protein